MRYITLKLAVALAIGGALATGAQADTAPAAHSHDAAPMAAKAGVDVPVDAQPAVAVVERFGDALAKADLKTVASLLDADVLILESGGAERSRDEYLGHHAVADAAFLKETHVQLKQRRARIHGDLAWVGSESELHATKDGKPLTLLSTETMVLQRKGADWRILHIHWSSRPKR